MAKGKTSYTINFQADPQTVDGLVQSWLSANGFKLINEEGISVYSSGNAAISAKRYFEYSISGNRLNILAYLQSVKKPFALDSGLVGAMNTTPYIALIKELSKAVENAVAQDGAPQDSGQAASNGQVQYGTQQAQTGAQQGHAAPASSFDDMADKRIANCAVISLVLGILNILLTLIGMSFGALVIIVAYVLAAQGLKSSKKNLAIGGIVTTSISLLLLLAQLIGLFG